MEVIEKIEKLKKERKQIIESFGAKPIENTYIDREVKK